VTFAFPSPGDLLDGRYRIVRLLEAGNVGAVFEAQARDTRKRVAIKWMRPEPGRRRSAHPRMLHEAHIASRVDHPNVLDVHDVAWDGPALFLVMELLEGETLRAAMQRAGTPLHALLALLVDAMRGVAAAHRLGVIHRDLSPDNIFLAREEDRARPVPKVLNFGIAKLSGREHLSLTDADLSTDALAYVSHEQLSDAADVDARTDIYALGVILYELATSTLPFRADDPLSLAAKIATTEPASPRSLRDELPAELDALISQAISRDRTRRQASVEALIDQLEPFTNEQGFRARMAVPTAELPRVVRAPGRTDGRTGSESRVTARR
jgi:eukaryotic-like serine/threonine-protein kinase